MLIENIKEAFQNLLSNKMRSLLTMLGIIIGISAVITITTIGTSIKSTLNATLNSLGGNSISASVDAIYPEDDADWSNWEYPKMTADDYITQDMLDELQETYPDEIAGFGISAYLGSGQIYKNSDKYANVDATGTTKEELEYMKINILRGRNLTNQDMKKEKRVCVVSDTMASYYFGSEDPIGQQIIYSGSDGYSYEFTVVGVYEYNAAIFGKQDTTIPEKDRSTTMYIPATTANKLNHSEVTNGYTYVSVLLKTGADQNQAETDIQSFFADKYAKNEKWQVTTYNMSSVPLDALRSGPRQPLPSVLYELQDPEGRRRGPEEGSPGSVRRGSRCARADARHSGHFRSAAHVVAFSPFRRMAKTLDAVQQPGGASLTNL